MQLCKQHGCDCAQPECAQSDATHDTIKNREISTRLAPREPTPDNSKNFSSNSKNLSANLKSPVKKSVSFSQNSKNQSADSVNLLGNIGDKIREKVETDDTPAKPRAVKTIADILREQPEKASRSRGEAINIILEEDDGTDSYPPEMVPSDDESLDHAENVSEIDTDSEGDFDDIDDSKDPLENFGEEVLRIREERIQRQKSLGLPVTECERYSYPMGPCWSFKDNATAVVVEQFSEKICIASEDQGQKIFVTLDSGAVAHCANPRDLPGTIEVHACDEARNFVNANGNSIDHYGSAKVRLQQSNGSHITNTFQVMDVCRPLHSAPMIADQGFVTIFIKNGVVVVPAGVLNDLLATVKHVATYKRFGGFYVAEVVPKDPARVDQQPFAGPGRSR